MLPSFASLRVHSRLLLLFLAFATPSHAHDLYTSWTDVHLRPERLELTLTLARAAALRLLPGSHTSPPITPENFRDYEPDLRRLASSLFQLTAAGKPLKFLSATVAISGDADITFKLSYAAPLSPPLHFHANYLRRQVDGHTGTIAVMNAQGENLDWSPVTIEQPTFEVRTFTPKR